MDIFSLDCEYRNRLDVVVRLRDHKILNDSVLNPSHIRLFPALLINQLKLALTICGKGLSQFNVMPRDQIDRLQAIAITDSKDLEGFWDAQKGLFDPSSRIAPVKVYFVSRQEIFVTVIGVPLYTGDRKTTIGDLMESYDIIAEEVICQGVSVWRDTPVEFLRNECIYGDGFVHLVSFTS